MSALTELFAELELLVAKMESIAFGDEDEVVTHNGVTRASLSKEILDKFTSLQALVVGKIPFKTKVALINSGAPSVDVNGNFPLAYVWNDLAVAQNGLYGWDDDTSAWIKSEYDSVSFADGANVLFDSLNQVVTKVKDINGFDHFLSGGHVVVPNIFSKDGSALESTSDGARVARDFNIPSDYAGKSLAVRTYADFDVGGNYTLVYRDANRNLISSKSLFPAPGAGGKYYSIRQDVPANAAVLSIILDPGSGKVRSHFYGASFQGVPQPSEVVNSINIFNALSRSSNILFDSFNRFASVSTQIEGFKSVNSGRIIDSQNEVINHPVLTNSAGDSLNKFERLYSVDRAGLVEADTFNLRVSVWSAVGCTVKIHFRKSTGAVRAFVSSKVAAAGFVELSFDDITVYSDSNSLSVIVENPSGAAELISSFASKTGVPSDNELLPTPSEMSEVVGLVTNSGVAAGKLIVNSVQLSPSDLHVSFAHAVSVGLWEFVAAGQAYRVLESAPGVVICVPTSGAVTLVLVSGQSLSVGASSGNTVDPAAGLTGFTGRMLMPGSKSQGVEDWALTTDSIPALEYLKNDSNLSYSPGASAIYQALSLGIDASFLLLSHGISGKQIEYLRDGNSTANGAIQLQRAKSLIESYGLRVDSRVPMIWNQGEADGTDANYSADLVSLVEKYKAMIATHLGSGYSLTFLVDQVSRSYSKAPALAQYQVCDSRDDSIMVLTKAHMQLKYNMAVETGSSDKTHMSKRGYFFMGAYWGKAIHGLLNNGDFNSLDKRAITIDGKSIHIDFLVSNSRLVFDSSIDVENLGFSYDDNLSNTIVSAEIVSRDRVTLTMSADLGSATNRVLGLGRNVEATGNYTGSPLRTSSQLFVPEVGEYLHDWALCWEVAL